MYDWTQFLGSNFAQKRDFLVVSGCIETLINLPSFSDTKACKADQFKCVTSGHCISADSRCDGVSECIDNSDEAGCGKSKKG